MVLGLGFAVWVFRVSGLGLKVKGFKGLASRFMVLGFGVWDLWFWVWGSGS